MSRRKMKWTNEEIEYLESSWGSLSLKAIAKHLDRSLDAIKLKGCRLGLGDQREHYDGITVHQLSIALNTSYGIVKSWIKDNGFPAKKKIFSEDYHTLVVTWKAFWKWAEKNKHVIDFSRVEYLSLGPEPSWVSEKRKADQLLKLRIKTIPWTKNDDARLKYLLNTFEKSYTDIARDLHRSEAAVKKRILDLKLKQRPVRRPGHVKYTDEEITIIQEMYEKGYHVDLIADKLGKSALGVKGKLERLGYRFNKKVATKREVV